MANVAPIFAGHSNGEMMGSSIRDPHVNNGTDDNQGSRYSQEHNYNRILESSPKQNQNNPTMPYTSPTVQLKKMGWYWGSINPDYAAKLLKDEEDGSFLVRDSSNECYIFSMTFKLEGQVHHARIEHSKGQFSFGRSFSKFYHSTIVGFIEQAIEYSHNENLSFFLHRDPSMEGPVRFKMIPLSRLKSISSLKHMSRFAILPYVRKDRIHELEIPECLKDYLHEPFQPV